MRLRPRFRAPVPPATLAVRAYSRLFAQIPVDESWERAVRAASSRGPVVHVLRGASLLDLLTLHELTRRLGLPPLEFASELGAWLAPTAPLSRSRQVDRLVEVVRAGGSAVLFLRPPREVAARAAAAPASSARPEREADDLLGALLELQRERGGEIVLVPQTLLWTQRPERRGFSLVDTLFGSSEFPGELRAVAQFLVNYKHCVIRAGEPLGLGAFVAEQGSAESEAVLTRRLSYALVRRIDRERRAVLGPAQKTSQRVREEVLRSPKLAATIRDLAGPGELERELFVQKADTMLRELQASPDTETLRGLEIVIDTLVDRIYTGIDVDEEGIERVRAAAREGSIVFLPCHKSHVDYLLLSYVLRKHALQLPLIAAGDNLAFFPLGPVFRRAGAFFIRRSFRGDRLYAAVVDAYVRRLIRDGFALEFYLEGGRSRTGKLLVPKVGLLNMVVDAALSLGGRRVFFVPVSIGYERTIEEGEYAREASGGAKQKEDLAALLRVGSVLTERYGRASVQFGKIVELAELRAQLGIPGDTPPPPAKRRALVTRLAREVMSEINRVTAVTPGSLVALALLVHGRRGISHVELVRQCERLLGFVRRAGARVAPSLSRAGGELREQAVREAAILYVRAGLVRQHVPGDTLTAETRARARIYRGDDVIYTVPDERRLMLDIAKNAIVHLFVDRALVGVAMLSPPGPPLSLSEVRERVQSLSRLFKLEFTFRPDAPFDRIFDETIAGMLALGEVVLVDGTIGFGRGHDGLDGRGWVVLYAAVLRNFVEGYRVAARAARALVRGPLAEKDLAARALRLGEEMFLAGEIERSEAVSRPLLENALAAFVEQGYLRRDNGKLALAESFRSEPAAQAIETKIASYLDRRQAGDHA